MAVSSAGTSLDDDTVVPPASSDDNKNVVLPPAGGIYLASGYAADAYLVDGNTVIKRPKDFPGYPLESLSFRALVDNERQIYQRLGSHPGIIKFRGPSHASPGAIELQYANDGDLSEYIERRRAPCQNVRAEMIRTLSDTWHYIYSYDVCVHDIKTDNVLVHNGMLKMCDFTQGLLFDRGFNLLRNCPKKELRFDLLGIGCIIYSISAWQVFNYDYFETGRWPDPADLRSLDHVFLGQVITKCWDGLYSSIEKFYRDVMAGTAGDDGHGGENERN